MMIKASHHKVIFGIFKIYTRLSIALNFKKVELIGSLPQSERSILLIANHFSWWDGFIALYLNMKFIKKRFYFMMLEEQLKRFWYFKFTGGFSVKKGSRSVIESLNYASDLLKDRRNMVLIFPQGEIQTSHLMEFRFEQGVSRIVDRAGAGSSILLLVTLQDYFSNKKPSLYCYIKEAQPTDTIEQICSQYNDFYRSCLAQHINLKK